MEEIIGIATFDGGPACTHPEIEREPADPSVGIMSEMAVCTECGEDLSDCAEYERDYDEEWADWAEKD